MEAAILDFFATSFFLDVDDLEVDAFLFDIVTIIPLTGNDSRGWNAGRGLLANAAGIWDARLLVIVGTRLLVVGYVGWRCGLPRAGWLVSAAAALVLCCWLRARDGAGEFFIFKFFLLKTKRDT